MQVAEFGQLGDPGVETLDSRAGLAGAGIIIRPLGRTDVGNQRLDLSPVAPPGLGSKLQPPFPVGAPEHLLHELFGRSEAVPLEHGFDHFTLGQQPVPQVGRQRRNVAAILRSTVVITVQGVGAARPRNELRQGC